MGLADDFFARISEVADDLFGPDDSEEREDYIEHAMKKKGFIPKISWTDPEPQGGQKPAGAPWGRDRSAGQTRRVGPPAPRAGGQYS